MNSDPDSASIINPYAPSILVAERDPASFVEGPSRKDIVWHVVLGVSIAGGIFGLTVVALAILAIAASSPAAMSERLVFLGITGMFAGPLIGFLIAAIAAVLVTPLNMWLFGGIISPSQQWTRRQIRLFARLSGLASGWLTLVVLSGFDLTAMLIGVLPGAFALFVTPALIRGLLRKADASTIAA